MQSASISKTVSAVSGLKMVSLDGCARGRRATHTPIDARADQYNGDGAGSAF